MMRMIGAALCLFSLAAAQSKDSTRPLTAIATFHSAGLYWKAEHGSATREGLVRYREKGTTSWNQAHPLWFDGRTHKDAPDRSLEYRGSIVDLNPGTEYEVEATVAEVGEVARTIVKTWSETFPIAETIELTGTTASTLKITKGGTAAGYVLYAAKPGAPAVIDVEDKSDYGVHVTASYVIVRGLTLRNARVHGIYIEGAHDVVIENNDISGWGGVAPDGWGLDLHSGVCTNYEGDTSKVRRLVIQNNRIHHPRTNSNNWRQPRPHYKGDSHPYGPQGITTFDTGGNHVIRYNEITSDDGHYFNDGFGGARNFSFQGSPGCDSDIYGNIITHVWDDGIESEGANCNVRIWGNYLDKCYVMLAHSATSLGPLYDFRNVAYRAQVSPKEARGVFFKMQSPKWRPAVGGGRVYLYHNTAYRTGPADGVEGGVSGSNEPLLNTVTRNNVFDLARTFIWDPAKAAGNDFDYDLYTGALDCAPGHEAHGLKGSPVYDASGERGKYALDAASPGVDRGARIPNFNDGFVGPAPDAGAQERGAAPLRFGVR
jgi:parallel beta helix pectate lyase-like protein